MNRKQRRAQGQPVQAAAAIPSLDVQALLRDAMARHQAGRLAEAEPMYRQALAIDPAHPDALHLLGVLAGQLGRHDVAVDLIGRAIGVNPRFAVYHVSLGSALKGQGRMEAAANAFRAAIRLDSRAADAHAQLGGVLLGMDRLDEAAGALGAAVRLRPDFAEAYCDLSIALCRLGRLEAALEAARKSVAIRPAYPQALSNLAVVLKDLDRAEEAIAACDQAIALRPDLPEVHNNRGNALAKLLRLDEAMAAFDRAIALRPNYTEAHFHRAIAMLSMGDLDGGLERYEWRKGMNAELAGRSASGPALKRGEDLQGKTLFVHPEQGFGDTIQFCRYASLAADRGARVILAAQTELLPVLHGFDERVQVIGEGEPPPPFHQQSALLSLPLAFGTTLDTIPAGPPYLGADRTRAKAWAKRLGPAKEPRIGLAWSGSASHSNDRARSIPLARLAPLLAAEADWIALHKEVRKTDRAALAAHPGLRLFTDELTDFGETAALIGNLDLVVTVDTSVAHLAAALGKPTWILLPYAPDWRWLLGREDSPWYPSVRLFRQAAPGDWDGVVGRVREALAAGFG